MERINLKRLSIDELNILAGRIIDELSIRSEDDSNKNTIEKLIENYTQEELLRHKLEQLQTQSELIEEDIYEVEELIEECEYEQADLSRDISMGIV